MNAVDDHGHVVEGGSQDGRVGASLYAVPG
jgi:hypothetical protein